MGKHDRFDEEFYNPRDVASQSTVALSLAELPGVRDHGISVRKDEYFGHLINLCNDAIISDIGAGRETFEAQLTKNGRGNEALRNYSFF